MEFYPKDDTFTGLFTVTPHPCIFGLGRLESTFLKTPGSGHTVLHLIWGNYLSLSSLCKDHPENFITLESTFYLEKRENPYDV